MTNPMINPQPNYSGVTIQIANPTVNAAQGMPSPCAVPYYSGQYCNMMPRSAAEAAYLTQPTPVGVPPQLPYTAGEQALQYPGSYPPQYYLNNYNYQYNNPDEKAAMMPQTNSPGSPAQETVSDKNLNPIPEADRAANNVKDEGTLKDSSATETTAEKSEPQNLEKSQNIIDDLDARENALKLEEENKQKKNVVALTDEYIKSLENYLNNPNQEIRLMASKEILTRLDEDKSRFDDAALNALLNKMLQDPAKLIRIASLSAFNSQLASGNEYTVHLLQTIQQNPNADKEDVLQAADILLKMSAGREVKTIPDPAAKENEQSEKTQK